jgi:predicted HTH transcriptional regulator
LISIDQLAEKLNVTRRTIIRDIEKLKKAGVIKRVGPDKGGYWEINSN